MPLKGAFINLGAGLLRVLPNVVIFQFNPASVMRTPTLSRAPTPPVGQGRTNGLQQPDVPGETMSFTLRLDANDQLAQGNPIAAGSGILPALSALELLMLPIDSPGAALARLAGGKAPHKHPPTNLPAVLFFWGPSRILPIAI